MIYRWLIVNSAILFITAYLIQFHDGLAWILANDETRLSLIIAGIFVLTSGYIGWGALGNKVDDSLVEHSSVSIMGLGLIGTIVATFILFRQTQGITDFKQMMDTVMHGIGTAQITTLFGLGGAWIIDQIRVFTLGGRGRKLNEG